MKLVKVGLSYEKSLRLCNLIICRDTEIAIPIMESLRQGENHAAHAYFGKREDKRIGHR
jgi:hypothetical protein